MDSIFESDHNFEILVQQSIRMLYLKPFHHVKQLDSVSDQVLRLIAEVRESNAVNRLRTEFGINTMNSKTLCSQKRAYIKWPTLCTWIADLTKKSTKASASTWVSDRYDKNDKSKIYIFIKTHDMETTSNWINLQLLYPEITLGLQDIGKIRTGSYWTCEKLAVIRKDTMDQFIPLLYKRTNLINNEPLKETLRRLVSKLLGGESKLSLPQLKLRKDTNIPLSIGLKTAKFMNGIHAAQAFIVDSIKYSPTPLNRFLAYPCFFEMSSMAPENKINKKTIQNGYFDSPEVQNEFGTSCKIIMDKLQNPILIPRLEQVSSFLINTQASQNALFGDQTMVNVTSFINLPDNILTEKPEQKLHKNCTHKKPPLDCMLSSSFCKLNEWEDNFININFPLNGLLKGIPVKNSTEETLDFIIKAKMNPIRALYIIRSSAISNVISRWAISSGKLHNIDFKNSAKILIPIKELSRYMDNYTEQWTLTLTNYMDKIIFNAKNLLSKFLADKKISDDLLKWQNDWDYLHILVLNMYSQELVTQRRLIKWILDRFDKSEICFSALFLNIIYNYKSQISKSRTPLRQLVSIFIKKLSLFEHSPLHDCHTIITHMLADFTLNSPDVFVDYSLWPRNVNYIKTFLSKNNESSQIYSNFAQITQRNNQINSNLSTTLSQTTILYQVLNRLTFIRYDTDLIKDKILKSVKATTTSIEESLYGGSYFIDEKTLCGMIIWALSARNHTSFDDLFYKKPLTLTRILVDWCEKAFDDQNILKCNSESVESLKQVYSAINAKKNYIQNCFLKVFTKAEANSILIGLDVRLTECFLEFMTSKKLIDGQKFIHRLVSCGYLDKHFQNFKTLYIQKCFLRAPLSKFNDHQSQSFIDTSEKLFLIQNVTKNNIRKSKNSIISYSQIHEVTKLLQSKTSLISAFYKELPYLSEYLNLNELLKSFEDDSDTINELSIKDISIFSLLQTTSMNSNPSIDISDQLKKMIKYELPRSIVYQFLSFELFEMITKDFLLKPKKVGIENWRVMTKSGVSLLEINQLCLVSRVYQVANCERTLIDILLWLVNKKCASATVEYMAYIIMLQLIDQICDYDLILMVQNSLISQCLEQSTNDLNSYCYTSLLMLRKLRKAIISQNIQCDLNKKSVLAIEQNSLVWIKSAQIKLKLDTMFDNLLSLNEFNIAKDWLVEVTYPLLADLRKIYNNTESKGMYELSGFSGLEIKDFIKITSNITTTIISSLSTDLIKKKTAINQIQQSHNIFNQQRGLKDATKNYQKSTQRLKNTDTMYFNKNIDTDVFIISILLSTSKVFCKFYSEFKFNETEIFQFGFVMASYLPFLINVTGLDILGDRVKNIIFNVLDELLLDAELNYRLPYSTIAKSYFVRSVLIGGSLISIQNLFEWASSKLYSKVVYPSIGPLIFIAESITQLFPHLEKNFLPGLVSSNEHGFCAKEWTLAEYYLVNHSWSLVNKNSKKVLFQSILKLLTLLTVNLSNISENFLKKDSFTALVANRIYNLSTLVGKSCILSQCFSNQINNFISNAELETKDVDDIRLLDKNNDTQNLNSDIYFYIYYQLTYDYSFIYYSSTLDIEFKRKHLISTLLINQPAIIEDYYNYDKLDYNIFGEKINSKINQNTQTDIISRLDQLKSFSGDEIWAIIQSTVEYWNLCDTSNIYMHESKDAIMNSTRCANSINNLFKYTIGIFRNTENDNNGIKLDENSLFCNKLYDFKPEKKNLFYLQIVNILNISQEFALRILNAHANLLNNTDNKKSRGNLNNIMDNATSEHTINGIVEIISLRIALILIDQVFLAYAELETNRNIELVKIADSDSVEELKSDLINKVNEKYKLLIDNYFFQAYNWIKLLDKNILIKIRFIAISKMILIIKQTQPNIYLKSMNTNKATNTTSKNDTEIILDFLNHYTANKNELGMLDVFEKVGLGLIRIIEACNSTVYLSNKHEFDEEKNIDFKNTLFKIINNNLKNHNVNSDIDNIIDTGLNNIEANTHTHTLTQVCTNDKIEVLDFSNIYLDSLLFLANNISAKSNPKIYNLLMQDLKQHVLYDASNPLNETNFSNGSYTNVDEKCIFFIHRTFITLFANIKNSPKEYHADKWLLTYFVIATSNNIFGTELLDSIATYLKPTPLALYNDTVINKLIANNTDAIESKSMANTELVLNAYLDTVSMLSDLQTQEHKRYVFPLIGKIEPKKLNLFKNNKIGKQSEKLILSSISRILPFKSVNFKKPILKGSIDNSDLTSSRISPWLHIESFGNYIESDSDSAYWLANLNDFNPKKRRLDVEMNLNTFSK
ncbi:hypothetical protein BB561_005482 [Smittium simulii]|uniref:Uncharacterized protein n=1 Tax=Smittium simulii TaxID=133385 RepID=A0A2T9YA70_9FUNG|nr:hypothetical protein BB561_005482 [Smittium simulii]